jgi:hypothetical protein
MTKPLGVQLPEFTYRTISLTPPAYERELAEVLFGILGSSVHEPEAIAAALNEAGFMPSSGGQWSATAFMAEMQRLGSWTNSVGARVGAHGYPGLSLREGNHA